VAAGSRDELLRRPGTFARSDDDAALAAALRAAGIAVVPLTTGGLDAEAEPTVVARTASAAGVVVTELRAADSRGLEDLFLELTADHAREEVSA
jgi:ABC-2 type transport system ATP-binding protein